MGLTLRAVFILATDETPARRVEFIVAVFPMKILKEIFTPAPAGAEVGLFRPSPATGDVFSVPSGVLFATSASSSALKTTSPAVSASPLASKTPTPVANETSPAAGGVLSVSGGVLFTAGASSPVAGDAPLAVSASPLAAGAPPLFIETTPLGTGDTPLLPKNLLFSTIPLISLLNQPLTHPHETKLLLPSGGTAPFRISPRARPDNPCPPGTRRRQKRR